MKTQGPYSSSPSRMLALLATDACVLGVCYGAAWYLTVPPPFTLDLVYDNGWLQLLLNIAVIQVGLYVHSLYHVVVTRPWLVIVQQLCMVLGAAFLVQSGISYLNPDLQVPKRVMLLGSVMAFVAVPLVRRALMPVLSKDSLGRLLLVGSSTASRELATLLVKDYGLRPEALGCLAEAGEHAFMPCPLLGGFDEMESVLQSHAPDWIIVSTAGQGSGFPLRKVLDLQLSGSSVEEDTAFFERITGRISTQEFRPQNLILSDSFNGSRSALEQVLSMVLGCVLFLALLPAMAVLAILGKLVSPGLPVLISEEKVGYRGRPFRAYRFHAVPGTLLDRWEVTWMPELFHVATGDMAFVGPRPEPVPLARMLEQKLPFYCQRYSVPPGLVSWAQVRGGETACRDAVLQSQYDLYYIKHRGILLDIYILLSSTMSGRNA